MKLGLEMIIGEEMKKIKNSWKKAIVYADLHTGIDDQKCKNIMYQYIKDNKSKIEYVIDLGDGIDNPYMSDFPVSPEYIKSAQQEFDLYARHWGIIDKLVPNAKKIILAGNHDKSRLDKSKNLNRGLASLRNIEYENVLKEALLNEGLNVKNYSFINKNISVNFTKNNSILFTHGDPRLDSNIKGGITGPRRTSEAYPYTGDIIMGHQHQYVQYPRKYDDKYLLVLGGLFDKELMGKQYLQHHPYGNGFCVIDYNQKKDKRIINYYEINDGVAYIDGKTYNKN